MMKLKIISFFLALLMMVQMVPVAQIGAMLSSNQWTEEIPHSLEDSSKHDNSSTNFLPAAHHHFFSDDTFSAANIYIHTSEQIPSNHSTDVVSPPPDVLA